jgi:uncharacterized protein (DUF1684 family)
MKMRLGAWSALLLAVWAAGSGLVVGDEAYRAEVRKWREDRESRLKADGGWLTVAGLFWLKDGESRFGSDPTSAVVLPAGAPARGGVFVFAGGRTTVKLEPGVRATVSGKPVTTTELKSDDKGPPDVLVMGPLTFQIIKRGERYGVRLKDNNSPARKAFTGLRWYDVREDYRITARFTSYPAPRPVKVPNILGQSEPMPSPGFAVFSWGGQEIRLEGVLEDPQAEELFFIVRDQTSGKETYPAGRFLYADLPKQGKIVLDFNKAYNPPCAFTPFATCPLPPPQNWMSVRIEAGELDYGSHGKSAAAK